MMVKPTSDSDHRYFMYSPEGDGFTFYATEEECKAAAEKEIDTYNDSDGYWFDEVEQIFTGVVTHEVHEEVLETRPENYEEMTEEEKEDLWPYPDDADRIITYKLVPLQ